MRHFACLLLIVSTLACTSNKKNSLNNEDISPTKNIVTDAYELSKPSTSSKAVLILFGGYPEVADDIKREFKISQVTKENNIAVLFMNFNRKLWLEEEEKQQLANSLQNAFKVNQLPKNNIYIGGMSSGGTLSFLISEYLAANPQFSITPKGVFLVDSPIDLLTLYQTAERTVARGLKNGMAEESNWLVQSLSKTFGNPNDSISAFNQYSVYKSTSRSIENIKHLKNTKIRLYTEPDTLWWKQNAQANYEDMNAYTIKQFSETLKKDFDASQITLIETQNRGYRSDGTRHPHSWSIVDEKKLVDWMLE